MYDFPHDEAPDSVAARLIEATQLACSRDVREFEAAGWAFAQLRGLPMSTRESMHAAALAAVIDGNYVRAGVQYDRILARDPRDMLALWAAQTIDYYQGRPLSQRARTARVLRRFPASAPGYAGVLAMYAFALGECGDYSAAEDAARRALELDPDSVRAEHALLHVLEMQGRAEEGLRRVSRHRVNHLAWHRALFHLQLGRPDRALALYDGKLRFDTVADLIDASALLWRLKLAGVNTGVRFQHLAARWGEHAEDAYCAFNDVHAMMAFSGARRWDLAQRLLAAQEKRLARAGGANHDMTRLVGHPASRALAAFGRGDYRAADALLRALPPVSHRIGGSHAQRDVLTLTRAAALSRAQAISGDSTGAHVPHGLAAA